MLKKFSVLFVALSFFFVSSCGTILKDKRGVPGGKLDPAIVALDAIGLLFFIIPGVVAFVIDYNNGTLYK